MHFNEKVLKFILTHTFLVLVTVGARPRGLQKIVYFYWGQRAEKFENHGLNQTTLMQASFNTV